VLADGAHRRAPPGGGDAGGRAGPDRHRPDPLARAVVWRAAPLIVMGVAFSPDGKTVASGSSDVTVKLWNLATGREMAALRGSHRGSGEWRSPQKGTSWSP